MIKLVLKCIGRSSQPDISRKRMSADIAQMLMMVVNGLDRYDGL